MSKISGFGKMGNPSEPFTIHGHMLGGKDESVSIAIPTANVKREAVAAVAKHLSSNMKIIKGSIAKLEVLGEMLVIDEDTESIVMDKNFSDDFKDCVKEIRLRFEDMLRVANQ